MENDIITTWHQRVTGGSPDTAAIKNDKKTHSKSEWQVVPILDWAFIITPDICLHKSLQTFRTEIEQLLAIAVLLLFRKPIF